MNRHLLLLRHAKSDWSVPGRTDHERPLNRRGHGAARAMGRFISRTRTAPAVALCSTAQRARMTLQLASAHGHWLCSILERESIYGGGSAAVLAEVAGLPDGADNAIVVGHEPTMSELLARLCGVRAVFPTAAVACVRLDLSRWADIDDAEGALRWMMTPKLLRRVAPELYED